MSETRNPYYFAHIPKTGGTSFIALLDHYFSKEEICPDQLWWDVGNVQDVKDQNYQLFRGHFGGAAQFMSTQSLNYLTIFRDPVSLAFSTYNYSKREQNTKVHELIKRHDMSFETFVDHPGTTHLVKNRMLRSLSFGLDSKLNFDDMKITPDSYRQFKRKINKNSPFNSAEDRLKRLKRFVLDCHWFGIQDDYDCSIDLLCYVMGWPPVTKIQKLNSHDKRQEIEPRLKQKIIALNHYDNALYNFAKDQFNKRYALMLADLALPEEANPENIKLAIDERYQSIHAKKTKLKQVQKYVFTPKDPIIGDQWHRREWNPGLNKYFCWSGPGTHSFIDFWMQPKDYLIKINLDNVVSSTYISFLELLINDILPQWDFTSQGRTHELTIRCDKQMIQNSGLLRIQFNSHELKMHKDIFGGDDNRLVGMALECIVFESI